MNSRGGVNEGLLDPSFVICLPAQESGQNSGVCSHVTDQLRSK